MMVKEMGPGISFVGLKRERADNQDNIVFYSQLNYTMSGQLKGVDLKVTNYNTETVSVCH